MSVGRVQVSLCPPVPAAERCARSPLGARHKGSGFVVPRFISQPGAWRCCLPPGPDRAPEALRSPPLQSERPSGPAPRRCPAAMGTEAAVGASRAMEAMCSELLLPTPGEAAVLDSPGAASADLAAAPPLAASQDLLLPEASTLGEGTHPEGSNVEIFIEAVAGSGTLSNAASATGMCCREGSMGPMALSEGRVLWPGPLSPLAGILWAPQYPHISDPGTSGATVQHRLGTSWVCGWGGVTVGVPC